MGASDMNHRTGKLTAADFEPVKKPPRSMWDEEREQRWLPWIYMVAFFGSMLCSHIFARAAS